MNPMSRACILFVMAGMLKFLSLPASAQRVYAGHSVLATGNWYKFKVKTAGVYRLDLPFLASLGINTSSLSSSSIRIFGNGGWMLPEQANGAKTDDLFENAIQVVDGGDGTLNGNDYIIFYATGPHRWLKDSVNKSFNHQQNLYSNESFYYITAGGTGKRIPAAPPAPAPNLAIADFTWQYFYELDTFNFLSSGREWFGEEFSDAPGKSKTKTFTLSIPGISGKPLLFRSQTVARSIGTGSRFNIRINSTPVLQSDLLPVANGPYDLYAQTALNATTFIPNQPDLSVQYDYTPGSFGSQGWLDWFEILARRDLSMNGVNQLLFRDWNSVGAGNSGEFIIKNASANTQVWDITNPLEPIRQNTTLTGTELHFVNRCDVLREYIAFNNTGFLMPEKEGQLVKKTRTCTTRNCSI